MLYLPLIVGVSSDPSVVLGVVRSCPRIRFQSLSLNDSNEDDN